MKKTRKLFWTVWGFLIVILLEGCSGKNKAESISAITEKSNYQFLEEDGVVWEDNRVDDLHAVVNLPVKVVMAKGELKGGKTNVFVGECGCTRFKNHIYNFYKDGWSGVNGITMDGKEFDLKVEVDSDHADAGNQIFELGPVSGKKGYAACYYKFNREGKVDEYWLYELNENFERIHRVQAQMNTDEILESVMGDANGNFHLTYRKTGGKYAYVIVSQEGKILFDANAEHSARLCAYGDGKVALCDEQIYDDKPKERRFYHYDLSQKIFAELAVSTDETIQKEMRKYVYTVSPLNDNTLAWCTRAGICVYDVQSKKIKNIYNWSSHGIIPSMVWDLAIVAEGDFEILYEDSEGLNYMLLKQTGEKEELKSITFAVSANNKDSYLSAAAYFHKHYPTYVINIKDDYDEVSLLTQLGGGDGPVLVDTELTGFESLAKLWQPLDGFMEETGLVKEMYPETLELGKIDGVTYGIVRNFSIETLLVPESGPSDWNYEVFLDALDKFDGSALTYRGIELPCDWREKYFDILKNSMDDTYFLNWETGDILFGSKEFERVLRLSEKARQCPPAEEGKALREGKALCEHYELLGLWDVLRLHRRIEKNGERAIGYPTRDGAKHLLIAQSPIAMRSTATEEEKKIGYTFLRFLLSEEAMMLPTNGSFSVRKDVLEYQLDCFEQTAESMKEDNTFDPAMVPELHREEDVEFFESLIQNAKIKKPFSGSMESILADEFGDYLAGAIDARMLDEHLKSRVWLFMEESK